MKENTHSYGLVGFSVVLIENSIVNKISHEIILKATKEITSNVKFTTEELIGTPKYEIVKYTKKNNVQLIIMSSTSAGLINDLSIGSTTHYVVNHAPCRVTLIP